MDKNCRSLSPDRVISLMSSAPLDSCTKVTVSSNTELPLAAQHSRLRNLASPEPAVSQRDAGNSCDDEFDDRKKVSYFNPTTGTSIIRITSEMFKKSRASSSQAELKSSAEATDVTQRYDFQLNSCEVDAGEKQKGLVSSEMRSSGAGVPFDGVCSGKVNSFEALHTGHSSNTLVDGKIECDSDMYASDLLYIDEPEYDDEEKVMYMDDKEEQTAWESVVCCQVKEPINDLHDNKTTDAVKDPGPSAAQLHHKDSSLQTAYEKASSCLTEACVDKNKMEAGFIGRGAVDVIELPESGWQENNCNCSHVTDYYDKTVNVSSLSKSVVVEASDKKVKVSPGPLRLTRHVKSSAQPESSYSVNTSSFFSAYHRPDVNVNSTVCQTSISSVTSILSLDSRASSSDEAKGWTTDRSRFTSDRPESSCRAVESDGWAELEDSRTQSFGESNICYKSVYKLSAEKETEPELRTSPEKMNVDDLPLSKSDKQATGGDSETRISGVTNHYAPSSYVGLNHLEVGQGQSEKLKLMQNRKEKKLSRLKAGVIDSSQISGNKGKCSIEELLEFINSTETEHGKNRKTSQKLKKQVTLPDKSQMKLVNKVTATEEVHCNGVTDAVPNGSMTQNKSKELADEKEEARSSKELEELPNDSCSVTILGIDSNGFLMQEEKKASAETVEKHEADSFSTGVLSTVCNGFPHNEDLERSAEAEKKKRKEKAFQAPLANVTVTPSSAVPEQSKTTVTSSSFKSASDGSGETIATDDTESVKGFTVVTKKKRNKTLHADKCQTNKSKIESLDPGRSVMHNARKDNLKTFPSKHRQLAMNVSNRHTVHSTWSAVLKEKPVKAEVLGKISSGDSSETSSVCSASVQRESTSFAAAALGNTVSDTNSHSTHKNSEASVWSHRGETRTLQSAKNARELQLNGDASCDDIAAPVVVSHAANRHVTSSHDIAVIPSKTGDVSEEGCSTVTITDTRLIRDLNKVSQPGDKVTSFQSSTSCQEMKLSSAAVAESSRATGQPAVVFDTREKSRFLTPARDIEISFGFDVDVDEGMPQAKTELIDTTAVPAPQEAKSNSVRSPQLAPDSAGCNVAVDINCNHPPFQSSINKSAVIALPSHGFQPSASHMPLIYSSPHHLPLGAGYVVPVPVGIVPPFMTCNNRPPAPATVIPRPAFESKDVLAPPELPGISTESAPQKQEQVQSGTEIYELEHAQLTMSTVAQELPNTRSPESSKFTDGSCYFDLAAAQAFLYSEFEAVTAPGAGVLYLTIDD